MRVGSLWRRYKRVHAMLMYSARNSMLGPSSLGLERPRIILGQLRGHREPQYTHLQVSLNHVRSSLSKSVVYGTSHRLSFIWGQLSEATVAEQALGPLVALPGGRHDGQSPFSLGQGARMSSIQAYPGRGRCKIRLCPDQCASYY